MERAFAMSRISLLSNPLLLGFEEIERLIDRANKGAGDGYPPYNVERIGAQNGTGELCALRSQSPALRAINSRSRWRTAS